MLKTTISCLTALCFAAVPAAADSIPSLALSMWARTTIGQVVSSATETGYDYPFQGEWLANFEGGLRLSRQVLPGLEGRLHVGFAANVSTVRQKNFLTAELTAKKFTATLLDASMQYLRPGLLAAGDTAQIEFGYFPFKYNPQSTNLGEYMFRSNCYPAVIMSGFENSIDKPKLGGLHLGYSLKALGLLRQDLILNSELDMYPLHDLNLSYIATYMPHPAFTVGAGVQAARLIVLDRFKTTPALDTNYHPTLDQWVGYVDPNTGDTTRYTFSGVKLMARATFDIRALAETFAGKLRLLGAEDLKLYGEAAVLGVQDYPGWYANVRQRIPVMGGLNVPTFKLLDVLSVEVEYFRNPYWNSQEFMWKDGSPVPYTGSSAGLSYASWNDSMAKTDDDWKWSIYASRRLGRFLRISAAAASDHTPRNWYTPGPPSFVKYTDMVPRSWDWYYMMRVTMYF
ncbi:MAG TPA: hypothetical protein VLX68_06025 [Chitinivibrionales bacterium]|nr:hypothetical protein [Chitinivibrionales bacterium]